MFKDRKVESHRQRNEKVGDDHVKRSDKNIGNTPSRYARFKNNPVVRVTTTIKDIVHI